jgi:hypothetical protein
MPRPIIYTTAANTSAMSNRGKNSTNRSNSIQNESISVSSIQIDIWFLFFENQKLTPKNLMDKGSGISYSANPSDQEWNHVICKVPAIHFSNVLFDVDRFNHIACGLI